MSTDPQTGSMAETILHGELEEMQPRRTSLARRSVSIFSRRGAETPEPKTTPFFSQAGMQGSTRRGEKRRSWMKRKSAPADSYVGPRGTILNAVPPAKTIQMTPLEEEMATSPNEEILSAISGTPATEARFEWPPTSPEQENRLWNKESVPLSLRTASTRRKEADARIGVWRNGVYHWDERVHSRQIPYKVPSLRDATGFTPIRRCTTERIDAQRPEKPLLSVVIPSGELAVKDTTISRMVHPVSKRSVVAFAPTNMLSRSNFGFPDIKVESPQEAVSPLASASPFPFTQAVARPAAPIRAHIGREFSSESKASRKSSSSTACSSEETDADSTISRESSATSVDVQVTDSARNKRKASARVSSPVSPSSYSPCFENEHFFGYDRSELPPQDAVPAMPTRAPPPPPPVVNESSQNHAHTERLAVNSTTESSGLAIENSRKHGGHTEPETELSDSVDGRGMRRGVTHSLERAPTIPKRSRKREWRGSSSWRAVQLSLRTARRRKSETNLERLADQHKATQRLQRTPSAAQPSQISDVAKLVDCSTQSLMAPTPRIVVDRGSVALDDDEDYENDRNSDTGDKVPFAVAENLLLRILSSLDNASDLLNAALINKGMYRLFKADGLNLVQAVIFNQSPPAWEFRQWRSCLDTSEVAEHLVSSYIADYRQDLQVIESLKLRIVGRCHTILRPETTQALSSPTHPDAQRFTDALWRTWCFCEIFGNKKGREEDVQGQLDWLKGGLLAHSQDLTATTNVNLDFDLGSVLLNPPEHFAQSNYAGLSSGQLYDIIEIWEAMKTLLEDFTLHAGPAWDCGVFANCNIIPGDSQSEEELLDEWTACLLTRGPQVVLEMAGSDKSDICTQFALAKVNGWTTWDPSDYSCSRVTFLKEPASRLYEERVAETASESHDWHLDEQKEMSRKRVATLAAEIKLSRQSSTFKRLPYTDMSMEHAMSPISRENSTISAIDTSNTARKHNQTARSSQRRTSLLPRANHNRPPNFSVPRPGSPPMAL